MRLTRQSDSSPLWDGFLGESPAGESDAEKVSFTGQRVLITGAGGYLGAAAARALAAHRVAHLCLVDVVEHGLYDLQQQLEAKHPEVAFELVLGSVTDRSFLDEVLRGCRPTLVLHAAALKHVPMLEGNAIAAAATNVLGTATLLAALRDSGVRRTVLCSTDKAVQPIGVMGATKKLAEVVALSSPEDVRVLRLCNVLGSTGSVAPRFAAQIAQGEPLTVTDREATRLWISQRDAVHCLLEGFQEDLPTPLAIPRHAQQRHITELAAFMLAKAGIAAPQIAFTGLRRGERLTESLRNDGEVFQGNQSSVLASLTPSPPDSQTVHQLLKTLVAAVARREEAAVREALHTVLLPPNEVSS